MQQRQLRLGDILDDYCPRERRVTNHAVVAMVGDAVKQTRCTTCDAEHEYKHAKVPRQRKKSDAPAALYAQVAAGAPKRVVHDQTPQNGDDPSGSDVMPPSAEEDPSSEPVVSAAPLDDIDASPDVLEEGEGEGEDEDRDDMPDDGPVHRPLIRASLPRPEGHQPPARPIPEFTIRQPGGGRPNRFRPRNQRGGQGHPFQGGNRTNGQMAGSMRGPRHNSGRPGAMNRHRPGGGGRKRSK